MNGCKHGGGLVGVGLFLGLIFGALFVKSIVSWTHEPNPQATEACAPYQAIERFYDHGQWLVVCRTAAGLVVRGVEK